MRDPFTFQESQHCESVIKISTNDRISTYVMVLIKQSEGNLKKYVSYGQGDK